ncbi:MAG: hypothetical protein FJ041_02050, partial [Candidatus Cloacimonetes bacterium]|nr:hypothetical protein [Candidatus Cloacimonadota bacterium]
MEKSKDKSKQAPNQNREIARSVIAIAVFSVAITGGLALLICLDIFSLFDGSFVYSETFATTAYWLRLGITAIFSIALSVAFAYLILRKSQNNKTLDQSDIPDAEETDINTDNKAISDTASDSLQAALDSERLMNNLLINMLYSDISTDSEEISSILQNLLAFVKSDYCGYYIYDDKSNAFSRKAFCDFDIDLARHSSRLEELQTDNYAWTLNTLQTGKASIFRTAMLDELRQKSQQAKDDAQQWINQQIQSSAEYKLCKNEGWQYLVCLPQLAENTLTGLFLFGYQKDVLPIQQDEILRLESYADTLGKYLSKPHEKAALQQSGDSIN